MAIIINKDKCIGCESCVAVCPVGALTMQEGKARVDTDKCILCGACVSECPVGAISKEETAKAAVTNNAGTDIWVLAELEEGKLSGVTLELMAKAAELAGQAGEKCAAVLLAPAADKLPQGLIAAGADKVYVVTGPEFADFNTDIFTNAFCELAQAYKPNAVLFGATIDGRDLAPRIAARLHTGLCADCTALSMKDDLVEWTRPALGGNIMATILCKEHRPQMGTIRPKTFKAQPAAAGHQGEVINFTVKNKVQERVHLVKKENLSGTGTIKIEDAEVIVAGGRGMGTAENFKKLEELAALFENSAVAGSRAAVDEKWIGHAGQVGQSGKTVTPKLYFACGISGALQHLSGMKDSDVIVAINKDPNAPIFQVASYGLVGDVNVLLPKLIEQIKAFKQA
jgi:electron transfer flavoprotein alpha subunit